MLSHKIKKPALKKQLWDVTTERDSYSSLTVSPQDCLWYMSFHEKIIYVGRRPVDKVSTPLVALPVKVCYKS